MSRKGKLHVTHEFYIKERCCEKLEKVVLQLLFLIYFFL